VKPLEDTMTGLHMQVAVHLRANSSIWGSPTGLFRSLH